MLDPIAAKGKAVVLNPVKIPDFSNALNSAQHTNDMQMQLYKIAAEQRQKEAALGAARAKAEQDAKDAADKLKAKDQADMMGLFKTKEGSYLVADAPDIARQKVAELIQEYAQLAAKGHTLYDLSPEISAWHDKTRQYHNWYNQNAEIAKTFSEKSKKFNENPLGYEPYNQADEDFVPYNQALKENKPYYSTSLTPFIGSAKAEDAEKYAKALLPNPNETTTMSKKPTGRIGGNDLVYTQTKEFEALPYEPVMRAINSFKNSRDTEQKKQYNFHYGQAEANNQIDANGEIKPEYFQNYIETISPAKVTTPQIVSVPEPRKESSSDANFGKYIRGFYGGNTLFMGTKTNPVAATPAQSDINAGKREQFGTEYFLQPAAEVTGVKMNNLPGNALGAKTAWKIDSEGKVTPIESNEDIGGITTDRIVYLNTNSEGQPYMSYKNTKVGSSKNSSARIKKGSGTYPAFAYKTDKDGNVIVVNLSKAFSGTLSEYGIANELSSDEVNQINGISQQQMAQPQNKTTKIPKVNEGTDVP